ncbi:MAG: tyrosine-type recombinase/integrase [Gemmatimonadaceae bacterium]|nr:tyrosine-type recombinase/integrase [Gemmatimonadaceae bacterium]
MSTKNLRTDEAASKRGGRVRTGTIRFRNGRWYGRVSLGDKRPTFELPTCQTEAAARERAALLADVAAVLVEAGQLDLAPALLGKAAVAADAQALADVRRVVAGVAAGKLVREGAREGMTFRELAELWTSGKLAQSHPDHVRVRGDVGNDLGRLRKHIYPAGVGDVPIAAFTLDHAERVMSTLPPELSATTRRHVALLMHRVLGLAVFPMRLRESNPLPRGWLPKPSAAKAKAYLYPDEEAKLCGCRRVPLARRVSYSFLAREGMRKSEALGLRWGDVDLERGAVTLDENKTDDPRSWALGEDVTEALRRWHERCGKPAADAVLFDLPNAELRADAFREDLEAAGVDRPELYKRTAARQPIRVHDLRASFITLALAAGRSEAWVSDRTGHKSSVMINRYRRAARSAAELGLGWLAPMHEAIPELANWRRIGAEATGAESDGPTKSNNSASTPGRTRTSDRRLRSSTQAPDGAQDVAIVGAQSTESDHSHDSAPVETPLAPIGDGPKVVTDAVEEALAEALRGASAAGQWQVVELLARELEARRKARSASNVVTLDPSKRRGQP